jgi:RND family efflux transporter MFP subunit
MTPLEIKGVPVNRQDIEVTVTGTSTGTIKSDVEVNITAQRTGRITKLYVEEGDIVKAGGMVALLDISEAEASLRKAEAEFRQAEANLSNIRLEHKRKETLYKEDLITRHDFDNVFTRLSVAEAEIDRAKAAKEIARLQYDYSFIKSPINGVVSKRYADVGDTMTPGPLIASVVDTGNLYISAPIDEADVGSITVGQPVRVTMDAYPQMIFTNKVIKISPVITGEKHEARTFEVRVTSPKDKITLKPGLSADIEIITGEAKNVLVVPSQSVIEKEGGTFVFIAENGAARQRKVVIGIRNWNFTEIKQGLKQGEIVIITPDRPGFKQGVRIKVVDSP